MTPSKLFDDDAPDSELPATDARKDFAADPPETGMGMGMVTARPWHRPTQAAPTAPQAAPPAQDGPKDPAPPPPAPAAPTAPEPRFVACPESDPDHPSRLPPAARPIRQG